jgi:electron transport complex protein RnfD
MDEKKKETPPGGEEKKTEKKVPARKAPPQPETPAVPLVLSSSPHIRSGENIPYLMHQVILALIPGLLVGIYFFGMDALRVLAITTVSAVGFEYVAQRIMQRPVSVTDLSAVVTGVLLAMNLPAGAPWWLCVIGGAIAIVVGKQLYGGIGYNLFNPALVARVFLLISWPVQMTTWPKAQPFFQRGVDVVTGATPLGRMKESLLLHGDLSGIANISLIDPFLGHVGGSLGEISVLALLLGGGYLIAKRVITWHIPASYIGTVLVTAAIFHQVDPNRYASPLFHLVTGGLILGAFFMATDLVTSPVTHRGMLIFGVGCGLITMMIRFWGGYPEGVSFSILLMNAATPLIDRWVKPRTFGTARVA